MTPHSSHELITDIPQLTLNADKVNKKKEENNEIFRKVHQRNLEFVMCNISSSKYKSKFNLQQVRDIEQCETQQNRSWTK